MIFKLVKKFAIFHFHQIAYFILNFYSKKINFLDMD